MREAEPSEEACNQFATHFTDKSIVFAQNWSLQIRFIELRCFETSGCPYFMGYFLGCGDQGGGHIP